MAAFSSRLIIDPALRTSQTPGLKGGRVWSSSYVQLVSKTGDANGNEIYNSRHDNFLGTPTATYSLLEKSGATAIIGEWLLGSISC